MLAAHALDRGLELTLEQSHDDGLVQELVFGPGQLCSAHVVQMIDVLLLIPAPFIRLTERTRDCVSLS